MSANKVSLVVVLQLGLILVLLSFLGACQNPPKRKYYRSHKKPPTQTYRRRRASRRPVPRDRRCEAKYDIYALCYKAGRGQTAKFCSTLSNRAKSVLNIPNERNRKAATTLCTIGCNRGLYTSKHPSYWSFSREFCRAR